MTEVESVYCVVCTESLYKTDMYRLYRVNKGPTTEQVNILLAVISWVAVARENCASFMVLLGVALLSSLSSVMPFVLCCAFSSIVLDQKCLSETFRKALH
jgi:hypothetical protein